MVQRIRKNGLYVPLAVGYYRDDAIIAAGPEAELLFVRALAFCADSKSDGFITDLQLINHVGVGIRPDAVRRRAAVLKDHGLFLEFLGGS